MHKTEYATLPLLLVIQTAEIAPHMSYTSFNE